jgi:hypothetical protein
MSLLKKNANSSLSTPVDRIDMQDKTALSWKMMLLCSINSAIRKKFSVFLLIRQETGDPGGIC